MSMQSNMWPFSLFAPGNLNQAINPGWFDVNINYQGNPQIEKDVVEKVASYGKQLGILTDAVLTLAEGQPDGDENDPLTRLRKIARQIEEVKKANEASLSKQADDAMQKLAKTYPAVAQYIGARYADKP